MKQGNKYIRTTVIKKALRALIFFLIFSMVSSCEKLIEIDPPVSLIPKETVFKDEVTAISAVSAMYARMMWQDNFASGSFQSVGALTALSSDEYQNFKPQNIEGIQFYNNEILEDNLYIVSIWTSSYYIIHLANIIIESLPGATGITNETRGQLMGEALFVRAFCHFNLLNMFGDIPLITTSDYIQNAKASRTSIDKVYSQVIEDLTDAQGLMKENYPTNGRVRPNKFTATALLARVYLYKEDWVNAEATSSVLLDNSMYELEEDLNDVFLSTSMEAIWQLKSTGEASNGNTWEGYYFTLLGAPVYWYMTEDLFDSFEANDLRSSNWTKSLIIPSSGQEFFFPYKYKIGASAFAETTECSMVFRLAEQYLIRAEARANMNKLAAAISDLDSVRKRADLPLVINTNPNISQDELFLAIERERRSELFTEWGHRWFDLKRTGRANAVLGPKKSDWQETDVLYPLPKVEFDKNPNLGDQNPGYE